MEITRDFSKSHCFHMFLAIAILLSSCGVKKETVRPTDKQISVSVVPEEYIVYSDYFKSKFPARDKELMIRRDSAELTIKKLNDSLRNRIKESGADVEPELAEKFFSANQKSKPWEKLFDFGSPFSFAVEDVLDNLRNSDNNEYWTKHPASAGVYQLSGAGFNETNTKALIYVSRWGGKMNGDGEFLLMRKEQKSKDSKAVWVVDTEIYSWTN